MSYCNKPVIVRILQSFLLAVLVWTDRAAAGELEIYSMQRVEEGLAARSVSSVADRVQGALLLELYLHDVCEQTGGAELVRDVVYEMQKWYGDESEMWVRYHLFRAIGELHDPNDQNFLMAALDGPDPTFRAMAAEFAGTPLPPEIEDRLVAAYRTQELWWVKRSILEALGGGHGDGSLTLLHAALKDPSRDVRAAATGALLERADRRSVKPLSAVWNTAELVGADSPVAVLAQIADPESIGVLQEAARSPYPFLRRQAAEGLGSIAMTSALPALVTLLDDSDPMVAHAAARALPHLKSDEAVRAFLVFLKDHDDEQTLAAALQMGPDLLNRGCASLWAGSEVPPSDRQALTTMCDDLKARQKAGSYEVFSTADLHSVFYSPYNADARRVAPRHRLHVTAWVDAVGEENGGERLKLKRGTQVTIWNAALYLGETWLEVSAGPYGEQVWIRERDLRPIAPEELVSRRIFTDYGAGSLIQVRKDPPSQ